MNDLPTLPEIGATVSYLNGTITRTDETRLILIRADGKRDYSFNSCRKMEVRFATAVNILRRHADLEPLPVPCLYCLINPRRRNNSFCSGQCEARQYGGPVRKVKAPKVRTVASCQPREEPPMPSHHDIMETLKPFAALHDPQPEVEKPEPAEKLPDFFTTPARVSPGIARREADKLIQRRLLALEQGA